MIESAGKVIDLLSYIEQVEKLGGPPPDSRMVRGVGRVGDRTVTLLDADGLDAAVAASITNG